jgi:AcrR family transcriptional regulator
MTTGEEPGLRERKRARTRQAIAAAALDLFDRQGFAQTTIQQVAEAADVSARTVSGYFPRKEDLAFPGEEEALEALAVELEERPPGVTTPEVLRAFFRAWLDGDLEPPEVREVRRRVVRGDESLRAYEQRHAIRGREMIAGAMAKDLGLPPDALEPRMAAAATISVFELLDDDGCAGDLGLEDALAIVERALQFIEGGIAALGAGDQAPRP